jgi:Uma2 family endonuclease
MTMTVCATGSVVLWLTPPLSCLSEEEFLQFCGANPELRIERTAGGDLEIMPPTGGGTGKRNFRLTVRFGNWVEADGTGVGFDSSTGFTLPNGAKRSPDLAWVRRPRWEALTEGEQERFPPLCPDFVVELRSPSDPLEKLQEKMEEYLANGAQLGWLIDPIERRVYVYRSDEPVVCLNDPRQIAGDPLLPGFVLDLHEIWG